MYSPLVSIITPTYKHEAYIAECIESVLQQTYSNWELIVVDDCSPDRTFEIVQDYAKKDARITALQKPTRGGPEGLQVSYNLALSKAKGDLIAVLEGDDYWPVNKLEIQVPYHANPEVTLSWGTRLIRSGDLVRTGKPIEKKRDCFDYPKLNDLLQLNMIPSLTVMARKEALARIGGFWQPEGAFVVDYPTWLRLSIIGKNMYINQILGIYRYHEHQITRNHGTVIFEGGIMFIQKILSELSPQDVKRINKKQVSGALAFRKAQLAHARGERTMCLKCLVPALLMGALTIKIRAIKLFARMILER
jgi:glycosyltransferase involved in cell wall biosynthesis